MDSFIAGILVGFGLALGLQIFIELRLLNLKKDG